MDGTEGTFPASTKAQRGSVDAFKQAEAERQSRIAAIKNAEQTMGPDRSSFNKKVKAVNEARSWNDKFKI
jgi:hypothetical protein